MRRFGLVLALAAALPGTGWAQDVQAGLSTDFARVGQAVQMTITVTGASGAQVPQRIEADGIEARLSGKSMQVQMNNFQMTSSVVYTYVMIPMREGQFTIPSVNIQAGGKTLRTPPLNLRVGPGGGAVPVLPAIPVDPNQQRTPPVPGPPPAFVPPVNVQPAPTPRPRPRSDAKAVFGELLVPKKSVFVGEVVPVELRFYFDAGYPVQVADRASFAGEGFTVAPMSKPSERQQEIDGRLYNVITFQTALTAVKSGQLEIPPATIEARIQVPPGGSRQSNDDFFGSFFGNMPGMFAETREVTVETKGADLEVRALPSEGRPEDFSGAIGQFAMKSTVSPKEAGPGDPITLSAVISGRGNFDGMGAPTLVESDGWRTYPPSETFEQSSTDPTGFSGDKRFEFLVVAREDKSLSPGVSFSFFDPAKEKYVTLSGPPQAVKAVGSGSGQAAAAPSVAAGSPEPTVAAAQPTATPDGPVVDLRSGSFTTLVMQRDFLFVNGALAALWLAAFGFFAVRSLAGSPAARAAAERREVARRIAALGNSGKDGAAFLGEAVGFLESAGGGDVGVVVGNPSLSEETRGVLVEMVAMRDELKYSSRGVGVDLSGDDRKRFIEAVKEAVRHARA